MRIEKNHCLEYWASVNPLITTVALVIVNLFVVLILGELLYDPPRCFVGVVYVLMGISATIGSIVALLGVKYHNYIKGSLISVFCMFGALVMLFSTLHFLVLCSAAPDDKLDYNNLHCIWASVYGQNGVQIHLIKLKDVVLAYMDCLHFSIVTSATVGYGDIYPASVLSKIVTDIQIVLSFIVSVLLVGKTLTLYQGAATCSRSGSDCGNKPEK